MQPHLRALYRRARAAAFSAAGRNPMGYASTYGEELRAARILHDAANHPPERVRDEGGLTLWNTTAGPLWAPARADAQFMSMITIEQLLNVYGYPGRAGDVIMDCGANIGVFSKPALEHGAAMIVCFEPFAENLAALRRNLAPWVESGRARLYEAGVWSESTKLFLKQPATANPGSPAVTTQPGADTTAVDLTTIDTVVRELGLQRLDFIKMDIEGAESAALAGGCETIRRFRPRIALGTEHTDDILANNENVIATIRGIDPGYKVKVTEVHATRGARGWSLAPYSLVLEPV